MGKKSRDKGGRTEREVVHVFQDAGIAAERIPLSGAAGGKFKGDVSAPIMGADERFEVKCRAAGFKQIYDWLSDNYGLVIRADRCEPLAVLRLRALVQLVKMAEGQRE